MSERSMPSLTSGAHPKRGGVAASARPANPGGLRPGRRTLAVLVALLAFVPIPLSSQERGVRKETVRFDSRGVALIGTLHLPDGPGPHPAIVAGHGSGIVTRSDLYGSEIARHFAPRGVAVLQFDKRGTGESEGVYPGSWSSSMVIYAVDILAGVEHLRARADIDASQVGLYGMSQAGWVLPITAAMSRGGVAFMIVVSGPTVSIAEENLYSDLTGATAGRPSGMPRSEIRRRMAEAEPGGLAANAFIAELTMPALWIYGALDQTIPWEESVEDIQRAKAEWNRDFTIRVFDGANHGLRKSRTGGAWERPTPTEPVDGYLEAIETWLFGQAGIRVP